VSSHQHGVLYRADGTRPMSCRSTLNVALVRKRGSMSTVPTPANERTSLRRAMRSGSRKCKKTSHEAPDIARNDALLAAAHSAQGQL